jgi:hypothetical protein
MKHDKKMTRIVLKLLPPAMMSPPAKTDDTLEVLQKEIFTCLALLRTSYK